MVEKNKIKSFKADTNLLYLIQQVTKDSSAEIVLYFNDISQQFISNTRSKAKWLNKNTNHFYKDSNIPYRLNIHYSSYGDIFYVKVTFPQSIDELDISNAITSLLETTLDLEGSKPLAPFTRPKIKIPNELKNSLSRDLELNVNDLPESLRKFVKTN